MNRTEKSGLVEKLRAEFQQNSSLILLDYRGLSVAEITELRRRLSAASLSLRVVKNRLARLASADTGAEKLSACWRGPIAVTLCRNKPGEGAKIIAEFLKNHPGVTIRGGLIEGKPVSATDVEEVAKLPSRDLLLGMVLRGLLGPLTGFVGLLSQIPRSFLGVLTAIEQEKRKKQG